MGKNTNTQTKDAKPVVVEGTVLLGSDVLESMIDINGTQVQLGDVVKAAFDSSALSVEAWNALDSADREQRLTDALEIMRNSTAAATDKKSGGKNQKTKMIRVRSANKNGFRRGGIQFTEDAQEIAVADLSDEQYEAITTEPRLSVEHFTA